MLMSVTAIEDDVPLTLERARPMIEEFLRNSRNRQATEAYLARARASAEIVYASAEDAPGSEPAANTLTAVAARVGE